MKNPSDKSIKFFDAAPDQLVRALLFLLSVVIVVVVGYLVFSNTIGSLYVSSMGCTINSSVGSVMLIPTASAVLLISASLYVINRLIGFFTN